VSRGRLVDLKGRSQALGVGKNIIFSLASIGGVLIIAALVAVFAVKPPLLGWIGFAIVSAIGLGIGVAATLAVPYLRVSPQDPARAFDGRRRLLVVADARCDVEALCNGIRARSHHTAATHLVVPVHVSHLHFLTDHETDERQEAEQCLLKSLRLLRQLGVPTTGSIGTDKPLESMSDALASFPATQVILAVPKQDSYWLEQGLLEKARALTAIPVTQVDVASVLRGARSA